MLRQKEGGDRSWMRGKCLKASELFLLQYQMRRRKGMFAGYAGTVGTGIIPCITHVLAVGASSMCTRIAFFSGLITAMHASVRYANIPFLSLLFMPKMLQPDCLFGSFWLG
jgi:hypothetical protein